MLYTRMWYIQGRIPGDVKCCLFIGIVQVEQETPNNPLARYTQACVYHLIFAEVLTDKVGHKVSVSFSSLARRLSRSKLEYRQSRPRELSFISLINPTLLPGLWSVLKCVDSLASQCINFLSFFNATCIWCNFNT